MTPVYDWTRFDALRERLREEQETASYPAGIARVRGRMADAREAMERGQAWRMRQAGREVWVHTPDHFLDAWEAGYRP